ncbi:hypothetical protein [Dactylosporangium sp. NPDC048998]|uniref:hypothetical protein n=1 Tax=Dactylosporangium sp. NPDC048998 TaxID=3363976 RepID=UPI003717CE72
MRKLAVAALAALCTTGAALAVTTPAHAADPACTSTIRIASMTWSPPQVTAGQGSTLTLVAQNCTSTSQQVSLFTYGRFLGAGQGIPPGCPVIDPLPPRQITIAAGATYKATSGYGTLATCTATRLQVTAQLSIGGTTVASGSADLAIVPVSPQPAAR